MTTPTKVVAPVTDANVVLVQSLYAAYSRGDIPYILARLDQNVAWRCHGESIVPWAGTYKGRDQVGRFFAAIAAAIDVELFEPQEHVAQGERVVSIGQFGGKPKATGKSLRSRWIFAWTIRNGVVTQYEQWHDEGMAAGFRR